MQLAIGRLLLIGVFISFVLELIGGGLYLLQQGEGIVHYQSFHNEPAIYKSISQIFLDALTFSPLALIQLGLLILVLVQLVRVGLTAWLFMRLRDAKFVVISLFILGVLGYSLFWR